MATYEYECEPCGARFEHRRSMGDTAVDLACPSCSSPRTRRVFSFFATGGSAPEAGGGGGCGCGGACACGAHSN
ncbi:MAG: zinc ribbon domain-containing protein [Actinomycetota bacterium]